MKPDQATTIYLDYREADCAHTTVQSYEYRLAKFEDWWGEQSISELTKQDVHEFKQHLRKQGLKEAHTEVPHRYFSRFADI